jgi:hypothetical protein
VPINPKIFNLAQWRQQYTQEIITARNEELKQIWQDFLTDALQTAMLRGKGSEEANHAVDALRYWYDVNSASPNDREQVAVDKAGELAINYILKAMLRGRALLASFAYNGGKSIWVVTEGAFELIITNVFTR